MELSKTTAKTFKSWRDNPDKTIEGISMSMTFFFLAWVGVKTLAYSAFDVYSMMSSLPIAG